MCKPRVSVLMPLYNGEKYVKKAIESILNQTYTNFELLLIDDCSTDSTMDIVNDFKDERIRIIKNGKNSGISYSRNVGLKEALGEYIALMDDDDISVKNRLQLQVDFLDSNQDIDVVGGRYGIIDEDDNIVNVNELALKNPKYVRASLNFYDPIGNGSTMFRAKFIRDNNIKYEEQCLGMEDYKFWIDCSLVGKISSIPQILYYWRNISGNETSKHFKSEKRKSKFAELQWYALEKNGFELSMEEKEFLSRMFPENIREIVANRTELKKLYLIMKKLKEQAGIKKHENEEEMKILLRKLFSQRIEFSDIWENS